MQVKIVIPDDLYEKIKTEADKNFRTATQEINYRLTNSFNSSFASQSQEIAGLEFPAFPSITTQPTPTPSQYTYKPDPNAGSINVPYIDPATIKDYRKPQDTTTTPEQSTPSKPTEKSEPKPEPKRVIGGPDDMPTPKATPTVYKKPKSTIPVATDLEVEQVDNEWDAEGNEYSTEEFIADLHNLEDKLREDSPFTDPTRDPDYLTLKKYFIKHDLRERFRSLLSDPSRFYPEEGVYNQPQIKYAQAAFRKEKIDYDYIAALLSGTGETYRRNHHMSLYVDEQ